MWMGKIRMCWHRISMSVLLFLILVAGLPVLPSATAQWQQTHGPAGSGLTSFVSLDGNLFAFAGGGIFRSTDGGEQWTGLGYAFPPDVTALYSDGVRLFAGTKTSGVFRSTDLGETWLALPAHPPVSPVTKLLVRRDSILAVLGRDSIYRSTDGGVHWMAPDAGGVHPGLSTYALVWVDDAILAGGYHGLFRSMDMGTTWTRSDSGLTDSSVVCLFVHDSRVFAGTFHDGLFFSDDSGRHWIPSEPFAQPPGGVWSIVASGGSLFAATGANGVYRSSDNGKVWANVQNGFSTCPSLRVWELAAERSAVIARSGTGMFRSTDGGNLWVPSNAGLTNGTAYAFHAAPNGFFVGTRGLGVYWTSDRGDTWLPKNTGVFEDAIDSDIFTFIRYGRFLLAGTGQDILRSSDDGTTWTPLGLRWSGVDAFAVRDSFLFAGMGGVLRSSDSGATWKQVNNGFTDGVVTFLLRGDVLMGGSNWSGVARTTNNGDSWFRSSDMWSVGVYCLIGADSLCFAGTYGKGVYRSSDDGVHWVATAGTPGNLYVWAMAHVKGTVFAGTQRGIFASTDQGGSWEDISGAGLHCPIYALLADETYLYAGTSERGVWRRPLRELLASLMPSVGSHTSGFFLAQNYPNPFNPSTTIRYGLPRRSHVVLTVYNTLGQKLATIVQGEQDAGYHEVRFDGSTLSSGVYVYRLQTEGFTEAKCLLLLR